MWGGFSYWACEETGGYQQNQVSESWTGRPVWTHRSLVELHLPVCEIRQLFERIYRDQNRADVGLTNNRVKEGPPEPGPELGFSADSEGHEDE